MTAGGIVTDADGNPLQEWHQGDGSVLEFILDYDTWNGMKVCLSFKAYTGYRT